MAAQVYTALAQIPPQALNHPDSPPPHAVDTRAARRARSRMLSLRGPNVLAQEVAQRLMERLDFLRLSPATLLDLGSGSGLLSELLRRRFASSRLLALEPGAQVQAALCADVHRLPLANASIDLVASNLGFFWAPYSRVLQECWRVLRPGGVLLFSHLGPDTLKELRQAFAGIDQHNHQLAFYDMPDVADALQHLGFAEPVLALDTLTLLYDQVRGLTGDLLELGARNTTLGRPRTLYARGKWQQVLRNYESFRREGKLPATFEIIYATAWKPLQPARTADGSQVIKFVHRKA